MADWGYPEIDDVVVLHSQNHDQFVNDFDEALVYYFLPKCKYCVKMDKFFGALALEYKEKDQRIPFAKFDCSKDIDYCANLGIPAYPFIKFFIRGHPIVYHGKRNRVKLEQFLEEIMNTQPKQIQVEQLQGLETDQILVILFGQKQTQAYHLYDLVSKYHRELKFFWVDTPVKISEIKKIQFFKDSIFHKTDFQNDIFIINKSTAYHLNNLETFNSIDQFINRIKHPDLIELDESFMKLISEDSQEFFVLFVNDLNDPMVDEFEKFAHDHKKKIKFLLAIKNSNNKLFNELRNALLIDDYQVPTTRIFETTFSLNVIEKYKYEGDLNYNFYQSFLRDYKAKKINPYFKSQTITKQNYGNVQAINSYEYQSKIFKSGQDSVVLYHSDFNTHTDSNKMLKILKKISKNKKFKNIKFFCIDADQNEVRSFYYDQRPVVLLYSKKDQRNPLIYNKEPNYKKVKKFIKSKKNIQKKKDVEKYFNTEL